MTNQLSIAPKISIDELKYESDQTNEHHKNHVEIKGAIGINWLQVSIIFKCRVITGVTANCC